MDIATRVSELFLDAMEFGPSFVLRFFSYLIGRPSHQAKIGRFRVQLRRGTTDALMFRLIFRKGDWDFTRFPQAERVWKDYESSLRAGEHPIIIDAGANVGAASLWFASKFPRARVVAVEPDADNARMCRLNTTDAPNVTVVEAAIGARPGTVSLSDGLGVALAVRTARAADGIVPVRTIADLSQGGRLLFVKVDIEGFESDLFSTDTEWLEGVSMVMVEPHDWMLPGEFSSVSFQRAMAQHRFEILISGENLFYVR